MRLHSLYLCVRDMRVRAWLTLAALLFYIMINLCTNKLRRH